MADAINIILDESKAPFSIFVEIETDDGLSVSVGVRTKSDDEGITRLRITPSDIEALDNCGHPFLSQTVSDASLICNECGYRRPIEDA